MSECDVVDFTFACIGGLYALQNCVDFVKLNPTKKAINVTTDFAKFDLNSNILYTEGEGASAMLIIAKPRIIAFENNWATAQKEFSTFLNCTERFLKQQL